MIPIQVSESLIDRFWEKVDLDLSDKCWEWIASRKERGYGKFGIYVAHRVSWVIHFGEIPDELCVLHKCDNTSCVNPKHLFIGTHADNMLDMKLKGRAVGFKGETNPKAKLSEFEVIEIRKIYDLYNNKYGKIKKMSMVYKIPYGTMSKIVRRETWNYLI